GARTCAATPAANPPQNRPPPTTTRQGARTCAARPGANPLGALKALSSPAMVTTSPGDCDCQCRYGADSTAHRNDPGRGMALRGGTRQDQDYPLTQAHTTLR